MSNTIDQRHAALTPSVSPNAVSIFTTFVLAAVAALATWEIFARLIAPLWIGGPLEPAGLIQSVFNSALVKDLFGSVGLTKSGAEALHIFTGLVGYPLGYLLVVRPLARATVPALPWWFVSAVYGTALWVFALYIMAHLIAGFPAFIGFGALTWASLVGHVAYAVVLGAIVRARFGA
ncbi:MAG: hypothetical protein AAFV45_02685 [Pseudomonadota bacterium]